MRGDRGNWKKLNDGHFAWFKFCTLWMRPMESANFYVDIVEWPLNGIRSTFGLFNFRPDIWNTLNGNREMYGSCLSFVVCNVLQFSTWIECTHIDRSNCSCGINPCKNIPVFYSIQSKLKWRITNVVDNAIVRLWVRIYRIDAKRRRPSSVMDMDIGYHLYIFYHEPININYVFRLRIMILRRHSHHTHIDLRWNAFFAWQTKCFR